MPIPVLPSASFLEMARGVRELHRLMAAGMADDSAEADAIRDATDPAWQALSERERERVRNLSEDLFSLFEPQSARQPKSAELRSKMDEVVRARQQSDWDAALELLRRSAAHIDAAELSYLRGVVWHEAGDPETADLFFEHAARLDPLNEDYAAAARRASAGQPK